MKGKFFLSASLVIFIFFFFSTILIGQQEPGNKTEKTLQNQEKRIKREHLIEDVRQLAEIIESSHPDPYSAGGGRIQFHFRLQKVLRAIPENGMTKDEFVKLLRPFVAAVGDQHTEIYTDYSFNSAFPGGLPFVFGLVEKYPYIQIPFLEKDQKYYGSILFSVEGVTIPALIERFKQLEGCENDYFALRRFSRNNLLYEPYLAELIPEWTDKTKVTFELKRPSGQIEQLTRTLPIEIKPPLHYPESTIDLPKTDDSGFLCDFIDPLEKGEKIAYLRVDHMSGYREAKEMSVTEGTENYSEEELQSFPSATESFRTFVCEMKKKNTQTLVIDLRKNGGGNYMMAPILIYFLYGKDALTSIPKQMAESGGGHGERYSKLYFKTHPNMTLQRINEGRDIPLLLGDIDFTRIFADAKQIRDKANRLLENPDRLKIYKRTLTFYNEYKSEGYSGYYCPKNVVVLITPWTSSSGLDMALFLYFSGASFVGTPSAQAPNSWGELLEWELNNSGIKGEVSHSFDIVFGKDHERGRVLPVDYPLTYEKLKSFNFDRNSEFLYSMELLPELNN